MLSINRHQTAANDNNNNNNASVFLLLRLHPSEGE